MLNRLYDLSDWIQYLQYESEKRMNQIFTFIIVVISLLQILIPIYIYSQNIIVILVYGGVIAVLAFTLIIVTSYGKASKRQKLAEQILNDIMVTRKYKTTIEIREAWIEGLKKKSDNDC
jgi:ferritin-like protein